MFGDSEHPNNEKIKYGDVDNIAAQGYIDECNGWSCLWASWCEVLVDLDSPSTHRETGSNARRVGVSPSHAELGRHQTCLVFGVFELW